MKHKTKKNQKRRGSKAQDGIYQKSPGVLSNPSPDGGVLVLHFGDVDRFFRIDGLAAQTWLMLDGTKTLSSIRERLSAQHGIPPASLDQALHSFISKLKQKKLVAQL